MERYPAHYYTYWNAVQHMHTTASKRNHPPAAAKTCEAAKRRSLFVARNSPVFRST